MSQTTQETQETFKPGDIVVFKEDAVKKYHKLNIEALSSTNLTYMGSISDMLTFLFPKGFNTEKEFEVISVKEGCVNLYSSEKDDTYYVYQEVIKKAQNSKHNYPTLKFTKKDFNELAVIEYSRWLENNKPKVWSRNNFSNWVLGVPDWASEKTLYVIDTPEAEVRKAIYDGKKVLQENTNLLVIEIAGIYNLASQSLWSFNSYYLPNYEYKWVYYRSSSKCFVTENYHRTSEDAKKEIQKEYPEYSNEPEKIENIKRKV